MSRGGGSDTWSLYVCPIGSVTPQKLAGAENGQGHTVQPFWSADSRFIEYVTGGKLWKIEASGGPPQKICDVADFYGGTWNREGTILFGSATGLFRVSAEGGKQEALTTLEQGESGHYWPHFLPDGRHYLYTAWNGEAARRAIVVGTLGSKEKTRVVAAESNAVYAEPGFLLFHRGNAVYAQPFSLRKLALTGEPARVADEVSYIDSNGWGNFAVSPNGVLVYFQDMLLTSSQSASSDDMNEIYVQPFPSGSGCYQISFHGGDWPRWRRDGKELFYHAIARNPDTPAETGVNLSPLLSAAVSHSGAVFEAGNPKDILITLFMNLPPPIGRPGSIC